ncbi:hypothetical protein PENTCL1PPCAC_1431, partial [Pristionchus entomophagus]
ISISSMRLLLLLALLGATSLATFRRDEQMARFREKNEDKIKQAILDMESGNKSSSVESGERSDLAGMKRDPDDSIQKAARAHEKEKEMEPTHLEKALEEELMKGVRQGLLGEKDNGFVAAPFDYLMFTMIYPTATCMADDDQAPGSCKIPSGTSQWTIHGLWPNFKDGSYPQFCDHQKFDEKQVQQLHEQMRTKWPNLFPHTPEAQLWSHEWEKHGTCSKTDPLLDSQFKYFNMSLFLLDHIDLRTRMEQKGISPRAAPYDRETLQKSLDDLIGHHVQMYCLQDKKSHESLLADIRVCMDAELKPIDCPHADIQPYVRAGTVTPNDKQPLPVPRKCSESLYYVTEGVDISKSIDLLPPGNETEETGKKLDTNEDKDDYYDDEEEEGKNTKEEEDEKTLLLEAELMEGLKIKTEQYRENLRKHYTPQSGFKLTKEDITSARDYARVTEMARQYHISRARGEMPSPDDFPSSSSSPVSRPLHLYIGIACLSIYLIVIVAFFMGRRDGRQNYGRLQHA